MPTRREHRRMHGIEIRATETDDGAHEVTLQAITPGVVDDYGSVWMPDTFDESLARRLPVLCWSHNWSEPLGPGVDYETSDQGPRVRFRFSDFDAVPQARRAFVQVDDGTIRDCSVGFSHVQRRDPTDDELEQWPGCREVITKADLDEISLVLAGAVPGAKVLAVRSGDGVREVPEDLVIDLARKVAAGELTQEEAKVALGLVTGDTPTPTPTPEVEAVEVDAETIAEIDSADDALAALGLD
jgi:HK97 family phage prohead protease